MKKLISLLLAAVMLLSLCTVSAFAANGPMPTDQITWGGGPRIGFSHADAPESAYVVTDRGDGLVIDNSAMAGASYDQATNTLTLNSVDAADYSMFITYMGDDFKLKVVGDCKLGAITVYNQFGLYNTSLSIIGTGSLTVNAAKKFYYAVSMWSEGDGSDGSGDNTFLSVDDSVTLHLYKGAKSDAIVQVVFTKAASSAAAISVGGKAVEGVTSEKVYFTEFDEANVMIIHNRTEENTDGYVALSKSDPEGKYSVSYWDDSDSRYVSHYVWLDSIGLWVADPSFGNYSENKLYTKEEFEKEYTIGQSPQPAKIRYTSDKWEEERGSLSAMLTKDGEPDVVYCGSPIWGSPGSSEENPDSYIIYRVTWSEEEGRYLDDPDFYASVDADDLESEGYHFVYENVEQRKEFTAWYYPAPFDDDNWQQRNEQMNRASDPEGIYVVTGSSYSTDDEGNRINEALIVKKVLYDEENGAYYLPRGYEANIYVPLGEIGEDFSYVMETVRIKKQIRHIRPNYTFNDYSYEALLLSKEGDDSPYCASPYTTHEGITMYSLHKLELRGDGHYYAVKWKPSDDQVYAYDKSSEQLAEEGFSFVMNDQNTPFTFIGSVSFDYLKKYTDAEGNLYGVDWDDSVYSYAADGVSVTFGDTTYYEATLTDKNPDDLISSERKVDSGCWSYYLTGDEYHHQGSDAPATVTVGDVDSSGDVTNRDAVILDRYIAGWIGYDKQIKIMDAADLDRKDGVTNRDAVILDRYIAGWKGYDAFIIQVSS